MSLLEVLQLIGYSTAAALPLWLGELLWRRRHALNRMERVLLALAFGMGAWHASNLVLTLHVVLGLDARRWSMLLRVADSVAIISVTVIYSLLLHVHLHLWAKARSRPLTRLEVIRVYLSYIPTLFLAVAVPRLWTGAYEPMFVKVAHLLLPFALWATYVLCLIAATDFLIARQSNSPGERRLMRTLAGAFFSIAVLMFAVYVLKLGTGTAVGSYLKTLVNLGSLLPTALLAYHVYRYRYLELLLRESLILATFAAVVLVVYLFGIRTVGEWLTARYALRAGAIESLLILSLALLASPLRVWLDKRFHHLFEQETALYRDVVTRISEHAGRYQQLDDLLRFVAERTVASLGLRRVDFVTRDTVRVDQGGGVDDSAKLIDGQSDNQPSRKIEPWHEDVMRLIGQEGSESIEGMPVLRAHGYHVAYPLRREQRETGLMLIDADADALTADVRGMLEILAGQVALAIDDCRLVEENVQLERRLAQRERLAALGQMAATVAHEVKNPLSAIKSIAQVMREDEQLKREYTRDLDLIVGETDRLSRSVTQMLSFARHAIEADAPQPAGELVRAVCELFRAEAARRGILIVVPEAMAGASGANGSAAVLNGVRAAALRDALSNLLLNALQATPTGGRIMIEIRNEESDLMIAVVDGGQGVADEFRERIWEPFFTTKQRGTGLGLAIVRKRMTEVGGAASVVAPRRGEGARFELRVPLG